MKFKINVVALLFLAFSLFSLVPSTLAAGETCSGPNATSVCCKAPTIMEDIGGCATGWKWIGTETSGECKDSTTFPTPCATTFDCSTGKCSSAPGTSNPGCGAFQYLYDGVCRDVITIVRMASADTVYKLMNAGILGRLVYTGDAACTNGQTVVYDTATSTWKCGDSASFWADRGSNNISNTNIGNVGIGTISPTSTLDVFGSLNVNTTASIGTGLSSDGLAIQGGNTQYNCVHVGPPAPGGFDLCLDPIPLNVTMGGNSALIVKGVTGNVGIGTDSPESDLQIKNLTTINEAPFVGVPTSFYTSIGNNAYYDGVATKKRIDTGKPGALMMMSGDSIGSEFSFMTLNSAGTQSDIAWLGTNYNYLKNSVGIGVVSPKSKLDVEGNVAIGSTYSGTTAAPANGLIVEGNVGIGTTNPGAKLDVAGDINVGSGNVIKFADAGQIKSMDDNHRILFRRSENKMELREYGDIVLSPGATTGAETAKVTIKNNGMVGIGTSSPNAMLSLNADWTDFDNDPEIGISINNTTVNGAEWSMYVDDYGDLKFEKNRNSYPRLLLRRDGDVSIRDLDSNSELFVVRAGAATPTISINTATTYVNGDMNVGGGAVGRKDITIAGDLKVPDNYYGDCYWSGWFSEEAGGMMLCTNGTYVAGMQCSGANCDNLNLFCCDL